MVDLAANMRRFVVVKSAEGADGAAQKGAYEDVSECVDDGNDPDECEAMVEMSAATKEQNMAENEKAEKAEAEKADETTKAEGDMPPPPPPADAAPPDAPAPPAETSAPAISLPSAMRQSMLDGLAMLLEGLTVIAEMVNNATVDEAAAIPPELAQALTESETLFDGLVQQFAPAAEAAAEGAPAAAGEPPPPEQKAISEVALAATGVAKAAIAFVSLNKAGRKMAAGRLSMLKQAYDILSGLLKELMDETMQEEQPQQPTEAAAPAAPSRQAPPAAPPPAPAPAAKGADQVAKSDPPLDVKALLAQLEKALAPRAPDPQLTELLAKVEKQESTIAEQQVQIQQLAKSSGVPQSKTSDSSDPPPLPKPVVWDSDLSKAAQKRRNGSPNTPAAPGAKS